MKKMFQQFDDLLFLISVLQGISSGAVCISYNIHSYSPDASEAVVYTNIAPQSFMLAPLIDILCEYLMYALLFLLFDVMCKTAVGSREMMSYYAL